MLMLKDQYLGENYHKRGFITMTKTTKLDKVMEDIQDISINIGKIQEHLKSINGHVKSHEDDIGCLRKKHYENKMSIIKITGIASGATMVLASVLTIVINQLL